MLSAGSEKPTGDSVISIKPCRTVPGKRNSMCKLLEELNIVADVQNFAYPYITGATTAQCLRLQNLNQTAWVCILSQLTTNFETLGQLLNPLCLSFLNCDGIYPREWWWRLNELIHVKDMGQGVAHSKGSLNVSYYSHGWNIEQERRRGK